MLEEYFSKYKQNIIGDGILPVTNSQGKKIIYADWAASGRLYKDIETRIIEEYGPLYANLHSKGNYLAEMSEIAYNDSKAKIANHFGANHNYSVVATGYGMTSAINKFIQIILGGFCTSEHKGTVFLSEYEHNSNFITWREAGFECVIIQSLDNGQIDLNDLENQLKTRKHRHPLIGSFTACSNVTGIKIELTEVVNYIKSNGGIICIDYTTIAPYDAINISKLSIDALVFSTHKFVGGVGGPGILLLKKDIYKLVCPTQTGGGCVDWVNPWGEVLYKERIEEKEETGTQPILQVIKAGLSIDLKEEMGIDKIRLREDEFSTVLYNKLADIDGLNLYQRKVKNRLPIASFSINGIEHTSVVRLLNERYGVQAREGCSCASIIGHKLLEIDTNQSNEQYKMLRKSNRMAKQFGWVRVSLSHVTANCEVDRIIDAIDELSRLVRK